MPNSSPITAPPEPASLTGIATNGPSRPRVVVAGGGVAALEGVLALREHLGPHADIDLVAPDPDFVYQPLAVGEPFGVSRARHIPLAGFAENRAELRAARLVGVDPKRKLALLEGGATVPYDALLLALGARQRDWLDGALHFGGTASTDEFASLLADLREGHISRIAFVAPAATSWTLPLYELAMLTAAHAREHGLSEVELTVVTPEEAPLSVFGPAASAAVRGLLRDRAIVLRTGSYPGTFEWATLPLHPSGVVHPDRIVTIPRLTGRDIAGLPQGTDGFIPVDDHGAVTGLPGVYAAGDGTTFPVKQGGIAAQQADAAAEAIAASLGAAVTPMPFRPLLRGQLLTGLTPTYLRTSIDPRADEAPAVSRRPLWWPPSKIAGRHLAPLLAQRWELDEREQLVDRSPGVADPAEVESSNAEVRDLARTFAEEDARRGEFDSALLWLEAIERLYGVLPGEDAARRARWERETRPGG